jgi:hypothetical protein
LLDAVDFDDEDHDALSVAIVLTDNRSSSRCILGENVVSVLHDRVAREPALRVASLRRIGRLSGGAKRIGGWVILECAPPPSAAVREPLAVLHHEIDVMLDTWHRWLAGIRLLFFRVQWILPSWRRPGIASLIGIDQCGIPQEYRTASFLGNFLGANLRDQLST